MTNIETKKTCVHLTTTLAALSVLFVPPTLALTTQKSIVLSDAREYRHCHNLQTITYCHKKDRLPIVSPPFSDRSQQRDWKEEAPCSAASVDCRDRRDHRPG
jgi:hypothetical protein